MLGRGEKNKEPNKNIDMLSFGALSGEASSVLVLLELDDCKEAESLCNNNGVSLMKFASWDQCVKAEVNQKHLLFQ